MQRALIKESEDRDEYEKEERHHDNNIAQTELVILMAPGW